MLQPVMSQDSRNANPSSAAAIAANFAYLSQQVTKQSAKSKKTSGNKHLELQKALKAQADKQAAEKRKSSCGGAVSSQDFSQRQEAQLKQKKDNIQKIKS